MSILKNGFRPGIFEKTDSADHCFSRSPVRGIPCPAHIYLPDQGFATPWARIELNGPLAVRDRPIWDQAAQSALLHGLTMRGC